MWLAVHLNEKELNYRAHNEVKRIEPVRRIAFLCISLASSGLRGPNLRLRGFQIIEFEAMESEAIE